MVQIQQPVPVLEKPLFLVGLISASWVEHKSLNVFNVTYNMHKAFVSVFSGMSWGYKVQWVPGPYGGPVIKSCGWIDRQTDIFVCLSVD